MAAPMAVCVLAHVGAFGFNDYSPTFSRP
jgi:hypothetical protein